MGVFQISPAISLKDLLELVGELSVEHVLNILTIDTKKSTPYLEGCLVCATTALV